MGGAWPRDVRGSVSAVATLGRGMGVDDMPTALQRTAALPEQSHLPQGQMAVQARLQCNLEADHSWAALSVRFCPFV